MWNGLDMFKRSEAWLVRGACAIVDQVVSCNSTAWHNEDRGACICTGAAIMWADGAGAPEAFLGTYHCLGCRNVRSQTRWS